MQSQILIMTVISLNIWDKDEAILSKLNDSHLIHSLDN